MLTIPNLLTLGRLAALPVVIVLFRSGMHLAAAAVFLVAMLTDCLDGWLARRLNQRTALGLYLDPVVDKILVLTLFYELAYAALIPWTIPHLFLARELLQNAVRTVGATHGTVVGANWMGKTKALLQTIVLACGLAVPQWLPDAGTAMASPLLQALRAASWLVLILSWCFFVVFVYWNRGLLLERERTRGA